MARRSTGVRVVTRSRKSRTAPSGDASTSKKNPRTSTEPIMITRKRRREEPTSPEPSPASEIERARRHEPSILEDIVSGEEIARLHAHGCLTKANGKSTRRIPRPLMGHNTPVDMSEWDRHLVQEINRVLSGSGAKYADENDKEYELTKLSKLPSAFVPHTCRKLLDEGQLRRTVELKTGKPLLLGKNRTNSLLALIVYLTGNEETKPCTKCTQDGRGSFFGPVCVSASCIEIDEHMKHACACCYYSQKTSECSRAAIRQDRRLFPTPVPTLRVKAAVKARLDYAKTCGRMQPEELLAEQLKLKNYLRIVDNFIAARWGQSIRDSKGKSTFGFMSLKDALDSQRGQMDMLDTLNELGGDSWDGMSLGLLRTDSPFRESAEIDLPHSSTLSDGHGSPDPDEELENTEDGEDNYTIGTIEPQGLIEVVEEGPSQPARMESEPRDEIEVATTR